MYRFVTDLLILVGIVLGVRFIAEGGLEPSALMNALSNLSAPDFSFNPDMKSLSVGFIVGLAAGALANVHWATVPARTWHWMSHHSSRLSYVALSLGFAVVLIYY